MRSKKNQLKQTKNTLFHARSGNEPLIYTDKKMFFLTQKELAKCKRMLQIAFFLFK